MKILASVDKESLLSYERLLEVLSYDTDTGIFINKITRSNNALEGNIAGNTNTIDNKYLEIYLDGKHYAAHRLAWFFAYKIWPLNDIDHIDGNKSNNKIANLREATRSENLYNRGNRKDNTSGYKGVCFDKRSGKYRAYININGKQKSLGYHYTAEKASEAYKLAAKELHKEFYNESIS